MLKSPFFKIWTWWEVANQNSVICGSEGIQLEEMNMMFVNRLKKHLETISTPPPLHNNFQTIFKNNKTTSLLFALYYHDKPFFISITLSFLISLELYREKNYFNTLILTYLYLGVASLHRLPGIIPHYHLHVFLNYRLISVNSQISLSV